MIRVELTLDQKMCLLDLYVYGHSVKRGPGGSVPCAAVSALAGSAARLIESEGSILHRGKAETEGELVLHIDGISEDHREWLRGITDFLITGMKTVETEYPNECSVVLKIQED